MNITDPKDRFSFGKNWSHFLEHLTEARIEEAVISLQNNLNIKDLKGKVFLDIGSGSGLFSLAAFRLGANVHSFDYDQDSVKCTQYLKDTYAGSSGLWKVDQGSVLDESFLKTLPCADVVYSWGVLHHTGYMYKAFENVVHLVKPNGQLFIAIYNDQGIPSKGWKKIKKAYVDLPVLRPLIVGVCGLWLWKKRIGWGLIRYGNPFKFLKEYGDQNRGMSIYYDLIDWVGGYPFEVATPDEIFNFFNPRGFELKKLKTCKGKLGCNEFVFQRKSELVK
jgi:2-polyprenyl-6-hydroxyphenyl methylase/3-demethylubiquinone-9 3-methyltransferase